MCVIVPWPCRVSGRKNPIGGSGGSWVGTIATLLITAILAYFVLGFLYNTLAQGKSGWDALPNSALWSDVGDFLRELGQNIKARLFNRGGYQQI